MSKFIATFEHSVQITEDRYSKSTAALSIKEDTTVKQIFEWMQGINSYGKELKIIELDKLEGEK